MGETLSCWKNGVRRINFGTRSFSVAEPTVWNSLPDHLHARSSCNLGGTLRRICSPDIGGVSALEVLHNRALQIDMLYFTLAATLNVGRLT